MSVDIDTWLAARERQTQQQLANAEQEAERHRAALDLIRQWRLELASGEAKAPEDRGQFDHDVSAAGDKPNFNDANDPTGRRRAIWDLLDSGRGKVFTNRTIYTSLVRQGVIPANTPRLDIQVTTRRMADGGQIKRAGRGSYMLPRAITDGSDGHSGPDRSELMSLMQEDASRGP